MAGKARQVRRVIGSLTKTRLPGKFSAKVSREKVGGPGKMGCADNLKWPPASVPNNSDPGSPRRFGVSAGSLPRISKTEGSSPGQPTTSDSHLRSKLRHCGSLVNALRADRLCLSVCGKAAELASPSHVHDEATAPIIAKATPRVLLGSMLQDGWRLVVDHSARTVDQPPLAPSPRPDAADATDAVIAVINACGGNDALLRPPSPTARSVCRGGSPVTFPNGRDSDMHHRLAQDDGRPRSSKETVLSDRRAPHKRACSAYGVADRAEPAFIGGPLQIKRSSCWLPNHSISDSCGLCIRGRHIEIGNHQRQLRHVELQEPPRCAGPNAGPASGLNRCYAAIREASTSGTNWTSPQPPAEQWLAQRSEFATRIT